MADTITLPGVGPVKKKYAGIGAVVLAGILAVAYYRHSRNAAATGSQTAAAGTTQDPNAVDPATGLTYGEEASGIQAGDLAGNGTGYGDTSGIVGYDAQGNPVYADQVGYGPTPTYVNNAAWAQAAQQYLVSSTGADAGTVAAALGAYLNGQTLTGAQASVVQSAIAFFGQPPDAGSNGYPPALRLGSPGGHTVAVPHVVGKTAAAADTAIKAIGLVPIADPSQKPTDKVTSTTPKAGTHVASGSQVLVTAAASGGGGHGSGDVKVPNVVGQKQEAAFEALQDAGLKPSGAKPVRGKVRIITGESPKAGSTVRRGTTVRLTSKVT